jgi:DNA-binding response OmpR family regulator
LPDLIVLDLMLPVLPGLEVCRSLRAGAQTRDIPIIMVTAKAEEHNELTGLAMGADDYVIKPFRMKVLVSRLAEDGLGTEPGGPREPNRIACPCAKDDARRQVILDDLA